ncbi:MAG TPA: hypothetical protein VK814_12960 [Acidobacteriaceae bacterium]|nr:hypothetical protein [Acidobacteriaceae bacterium]
MNANLLHFNASKAFMRNVSRYAAILLPVLSIHPPRLLAQASQPEALQALRTAVHAEMEANHTDQTIWIYDDHDKTPDVDGTYLAIETRQGTLRRLIARNGQPLSPAAAAAETQRIDSYVHDPSAQAKARKNTAHDDAQASELLKMLPDAFLWSTVSETPEFITLSFRPNPSFSAPDMESRVMGAMVGQMVIARNGNRIRTLRGQLSYNILLGFGLLAKMYKGGTFDVERRLVGEDHWQITETHVHIGGHALLFHTIGQQEDEVKTDWKPSTDDTLEAAARTLNAQH